MTKKRMATEAMRDATDVRMVAEAMRLAREWEYENVTGTMKIMPLLALIGFEPEVSAAPSVRGQLFWDIVQGVEVLRCRDGLALSDDKILERAANIVAGLTGNYKITPL